MSFSMDVHDHLSLAWLVVVLRIVSKRFKAMFI
jgi:hypothetical protein